MTNIDRRTVGLISIFAVLIVVFLLMVALLPPPAREDHSYSFEAGMDGWAASGLDLDDPPVEWSIEQNTTMADAGNTSLRYYLNNINDKGKIWIERAFNVTKDQNYRVTIEYAFATSDFGGANLWRMIAGALPSRVDSVDDLEPTYQDRTGNGLDYDSGYVWLEKKYEVSVKSGNDGLLWIIIGMWGTWEGPRTYFVDDVHIVVTRS